MSSRLRFPTPRRYSLQLAEQLVAAASSPVMDLRSIEHCIQDLYTARKRAAPNRIGQDLYNESEVQAEASLHDAIGAFIAWRGDRDTTVEDLKQPAFAAIANAAASFVQEIKGVDAIFGTDYDAEGPIRMNIAPAAQIVVTEAGLANSYGATLGLIAILTVWFAHSQANFVVALAATIAGYTVYVAAALKISRGNQRLFRFVYAPQIAVSLTWYLLLLSGVLQHSQFDRDALLGINLLINLALALTAFIYTMFKRRELSLHQSLFVFLPLFMLDIRPVPLS